MLKEVSASIITSNTGVIAPQSKTKYVAFSGGKNNLLSRSPKIDSFNKTASKAGIGGLITAGFAALYNSIFAHGENIEKETGSNDISKHFREDIDDKKEYRVVIKEYRDGNVKNKIVYKKDGKTKDSEYTYKNNRITNMIDYREDGKTKRVEEFYKDGILTKIYYQKDGKTKDSENIYNQYRWNILSEKISYNKDGEVTHKVSYYPYSNTKKAEEFYNKNRLIKKVYYFKDGEIAAMVNYPKDLKNRWNLFSLFTRT